MRTKIVATLGPSSDSEEMILKFAEAGVTIFRANFSHCTHEEYMARKILIEKAAAKTNIDLKILQDLQGPRIRVGVLPKEGRILKEDDTILFTTGNTSGDSIITIDDPHLHKDISIGDPIFLSGGEMALIVEDIKGEVITAKVTRGGTLFSRKGVNLPKTKLSTSGLTEKDIADVTFALEKGVDYIAISFVQNVEDVKKLRQIVGDRAKIIAKIETQLALNSIDEIIRASDGIMIARGDLGIEIPIEEVPFIQKNLIRHSMWHNKPSITATQMLFSMIQNPRPTRAEVADIAQAVWDGTDAVMLSDETASGKYPLESVQSMARIVRKAEEFKYNRDNLL